MIARLASFVSNVSLSLRAKHVYQSFYHVHHRPSLQRGTTPFKVLDCVKSHQPFRCDELQSLTPTINLGKHALLSRLILERAHRVDNETSCLSERNRKIGFLPLSGAQCSYTPARSRCCQDDRTMSASSIWSLA